MTSIVFSRKGRSAQLVGLLDKLGDCGNVGLIIGILAGGLLTLLALSKPTPIDPSLGEIWAMIAILSVFCWIMLILTYALFLQVRISSILIATLVRSIVICTAIVWIVEGLGAYHLGILIGILTGFFFGVIICGIINRIMR